MSPTETTTHPQNPLADHKPKVTHSRTILRIGSSDQHQGSRTGASPNDARGGPPLPASPPKVNLPSESTSAIDITQDIVFNPAQSSIGLEAYVGAFGDVFVATHISRGKVALKRPRLIGQDASATRTLQRLEREAQTWRQLSHEFVLPFLGIFKRNGQTYLVSPWMTSGHIRSVIERNPLVDRFTLITEIASGLSYLHSKGVLHGDLRAQNVLYSNDGHPLICDYGLYTVLETMQTPTLKKGTGSSQWQAPELWDGEPTSEKSDVYAFGMLIYEVLSGTPPFEGMTYGAMYNAVCVTGQRPPKLPARSTGGIPYAPLWEIAERCWAASPDARPAMREVHQALIESQHKVAAAGGSWRWLGGIRYFMCLFFRN